jgi:hypothetical protein
VVAVLPATSSVVEELVEPMVTVPPPASDSIWTNASSLSVIAAPALTVKAGSDAELFVVPPLMVKVAPF